MARGTHVPQMERGLTIDGKLQHVGHLEKQVFVSLAAAALPIGQFIFGETRWFHLQCEWVEASYFSPSWRSPGRDQGMLYLRLIGSCVAAANVFVDRCQQLVFVDIILVVCLVKRIAREVEFRV